MRKLILDSGLRTSGTSSEPLWRFSQGIRVHGIRLNTMVLPLAYNNVTSDNNYIFFSDGNQLRSATLTPGVYSADQLADELSRAMSAGGTQTYKAEFDAISRKLTVSGAAPFKFLYDGTTAAKVLGLTYNNIDPATSLTLGNPVDLTGTQMILLNCPELSAHGAILYAGRESLNIIEAIPITQDLGTVLVHQSQMADFVEVVDQVISEISFRLLDSNTLKPLYLQGETFQMILDIE